jgi:hypothetical protein
MKHPETRIHSFFATHKQQKQAPIPFSTFLHLFALICTLSGKPVYANDFVNFFNKINNLEASLKAS